MKLYKSCYGIFNKQTLKFIIYTIRCMTKWQSKQLGNNGMIFSAIVIPIIREIMLFKGESLRKYEYEKCMQKVKMNYKSDISENSLK
jgi:hypothetical protein